MPAPIFVLVLFGVCPSLSEKATFKQQESYVGAVGTKGREVELQFKGSECLHKVLDELVFSCKDGQQITGKWCTISVSPCIVFPTMCEVYT